jgi:hypothetical protein
MCHHCWQGGLSHQLTTRQAKTVDEHPVVWLGFEEDCILTTCKSGESNKLLNCNCLSGTKLCTSHPETCDRTCPCATRRNTRSRPRMDPHYEFVEQMYCVMLIRKWIADFFFPQATSERGTDQRRARATTTAVIRRHPRTTHRDGCDAVAVIIEWVRMEHDPVRSALVGV